MEDESAAWRERARDPVLALSLAAWLGELALPPLHDEERQQLDKAPEGYSAASA